MAETKQSFTGKRRAMKTKWTVRLGDVVSKWTITIGGIGTIVAVSTVFVFLLWVVAPLILPAAIEQGGEFSSEDSQSKPVRIATDEYRLLGWTFHDDGSLVCYRLDSGKLVEKRQLFPQKKLTASSFSIDGKRGMFGFADGSVVVGSIGFKTSFMDEQGADKSLRSLAKGEFAQDGKRIVQRISQTQFRVQQLKVELEEPISGDSKAAVLLLDQADSGTSLTYSFYNADDELYIYKVKKRRNLMTGKVTYKRSKSKLPYELDPVEGRPRFLALTGLADNVILGWQNGRLVRFNTRDFRKPFLQEELDVVTAPSKLTAMTFMLGKTTLLTGDSNGNVGAWFAVYAKKQGRKQGLKYLVKGHDFIGDGTPVTCFASSGRMRMIGVGDASGKITLYHVTSEKTLGTTQFAKSEPVLAATFSPKDDGFSALSTDEYRYWTLDPKYPEASLGALFGKVWYEGASQPEHVWQSSSGTDDFEPKLGVIPLIFGTIKATIFSLVFGVPIALLAAVFTSEFLNPKVKVKVKPFVEMMASLPSVVLGFLAALVFAPVVEHHLPEVLSLFYCIPIAFLLGAYIWQLCPRQLTLRIASYRIVFMFIMFPVGILLGMGCGPIIENVCFGGNVMMWLDGQISGSTGAWAFLFGPLFAFVVAWFFSLIVNPALRRATATWSWNACAVADMVKFACGCLLVIGLSFVAGFVLDFFHLDPRGLVFNTYVQRNALVVGFVMGFAIIPIIYTIAEDALSAVPEHLRSASLGAGATKWQTAVRVVIPTATSGLFSAMMIGLGRAVGETMIVLMAAGNTPIMDWNIFNGFRTLSANIAVELPEAVRNSTHYRTLFLAALTLFVMTFILNTVAEIIRIRFRKKAHEL